MLTVFFAVGCGKTVQAIAVMQHYRQFWPVLLLVPVSLANQWKEQLLLFSGDIINDKDIVIVRKASDKVASKVVSIVPYSLIEVLVENNKITPQQFGIVVADEAHNLKNMDTKRAKAALPLMRSADVALCLSGTPATNRPVELFSQLSGLLPDFFNDYDQYTKRYCDAKKSRFGHGMDVTGSSNESELKNILSGIVMIRRMKDQIGNQLPKKIRVVKWVDPDKNSVPELDALRKQMAAIDKVLNNPSRSDEHPKYRAQQQSTINAYTRATGISKISAIKKELSSLIEAARIERARELSSYDTTKAAKTSSSSKFKEPPEVISLEIQDDIVTEKADDVIDMTKDDDDPLFIDTPIGIDDSATNKRPNKVTIDDADKNSAAKLKDGTNQNVCKKLHANEVMKLLKQVSDECSDSEEEDVMEIVSTKNVTRKRPLQEKTKKVRKGKKNKKLVESDEDESVDQQRESIGQKIILFAHHQQVLDILAAFLDELEVGFIRVDGKVTNKVRNDAIKRFQEDGKVYLAFYLSCKL